MNQLVDLQHQNSNSLVDRVSTNPDIYHSQILRSENIHLITLLRGDRLCLLIHHHAMGGFRTTIKVNSFQLKEILPETNLQSRSQGIPRKGSTNR